MENLDRTALDTPLVLIVEDKPEIAEGVRDLLQHAGYRTVRAEDGLRALEVFFAEKPDLVVLDLMLPKLHGLEVLRLICEGYKTPVVILTAKGNQDDRLRGFELGADDYVVKPFWPRELVARVDAVLRRIGAPAEPELLGENGLRLNLETRTVLQHETRLVLRPVEFDLLCVLLRTPEKVFSRAALLEAIAGPDSETLKRPSMRTSPICVASWAMVTASKPCMDWDTVMRNSDRIPFSGRLWVQLLRLLVLMTLLTGTVSVLLYENVVRV